MILPETIALDTETTGLTPRNCDIFCVQIGMDNKFTLYICMMIIMNF
jgi:ribonuclease D